MTVAARVQPEAFFTPGEWAQLSRRSRWRGLVLVAHCWAVRVDELIFRGIEAIGDLKYARDTTGRVVGVAIEHRSVASAQAAGTGALSVTPASAAAR